ncbi:MAG: acyl carrier protein [Micromonosporaceae bacterium]
MNDDDIRGAVRTIWAQVLGVPRTGDATFFTLGGHSIAAFQILAKIEDRYGVALEVDELFDDPTADQFADTVSTALSAA